MKALSEHAEILKKSILERNDFNEDEAGLALLDSGLRALDLEAECLDILQRDGLLVKGDRGNTKAHPLCNVSRDARSQFFTAMKMLGLLDVVGETKGPGRPTEWERYQNGKIYAGGKK